MMLPLLSRIFRALIIVQTLIGSLYASPNHSRRADTSPCALFGSIDPGTGGRSVGIVIDSSASMEETDPDHIRLQAAKALVGKLISPANATNGKTQDLVAIVEFNDTAQLLYPLGDPAGAGPAIDSIGADGGTFIGGGVEVAAGELTKPGNYPGAGHRGIVVLTDGVDDPPDQVPQTIEAINNAAGLGIRISFGFLTIDAPPQDQGILEAVISSGGTFSSLSAAVDIEKFVAQVLLNGLTGPPSSGPTVVLPGLTTASLLTKTGSNTFSYSAKAGEEFNITVQGLQEMTLTIALRDYKAGTELRNATTDPGTGIAFLEYTAASNGEFEIVVTGDGSDSGIFTVDLESSFDPCQSASSSSTSSSSVSTTASSSTTSVAASNSTTPAITSTTSTSVETNPAVLTTPGTTFSANTSTISIAHVTAGAEPKSEVFRAVELGLAFLGILFAAV